MIIRSKAPLRLGLAGGGSDVSPYCDIYGGCVLNATISLHTYCCIEETHNGTIELSAVDQGREATYASHTALPLDGRLDLHKATYNRIVQDFQLSPLSFRMVTWSDAPAGSGLGSSSTMVVCILKAFVEWLNLPLGNYEIARLAYWIERIDLNLSGGRQDQYAAVFGGFNFMEFHKDDQVIVNPLAIKQWVIDELEASLVLYYTGASRASAAIIDEQKANISGGRTEAIEATHRLKENALKMKKALLAGNIPDFARIFGEAWEHKKKMAGAISNLYIQSVFEVAMSSGATAGKVSGAGGGGFIIFAVAPEQKFLLTERLNSLGGRVTGFHFSEGGPHGWKVYNAWK